jgi:hypothetical protein
MPSYSWSLKEKCTNYRDTKTDATLRRKDAERYHTLRRWHPETMTWCTLKRCMGHAWKVGELLEGLAREKINSLHTTLHGACMTRCWAARGLQHAEAGLDGPVGVGFDMWDGPTGISLSLRPAVRERHKKNSGQSRWRTRAPADRSQFLLEEQIARTGLSRVADDERSMLRIEKPTDRAWYPSRRTYRTDGVGRYGYIDGWH